MTSQPLPFRTLERALDAVCAACMAIASVALVVLVATFGWLVFGRYVLNATPTWVEQLALLLICHIVFLGAAAGVREETHIGVMLFRDMTPEPVRKALAIAVDVAMAVFGAVMALAGAELAAFGWDTMLPMLNIPESVRTSAIMSLGALTLLFSGSRALLNVMRFRHPSPHTAGQAG